jgi:DNA-binding NarL/FixJ family response regulator
VVLQKVVDGLTYKDIASTLFITERTVKYHVREILQSCICAARARPLPTPSAAGW